jgi:hypothetical protein
MPADDCTTPPAGSGRGYVDKEKRRQGDKEKRKQR